MTNPNQIEELREQVYKIIGEHEVIGDTTFGLGYKEANELTDQLLQLFQNRLERAVEEALGLLEYDGRYDLLSDYQRSVLIKHHKTALAQLNQLLEEEQNG